MLSLRKIGCLLQMWGIMKLKKSIMLLVLSAIFVAASVAVLPLSSGIRAEESYVYTEINPAVFLSSADYSEKPILLVYRETSEKGYAITANGTGVKVIPTAVEISNGQVLLSNDKKSMLWTVTVDGDYVFFQNVETSTCYLVKDKLNNYPEDENCYYLEAFKAGKLAWMYGNAWLTYANAKFSVGENETVFSVFVQTKKVATTYQVSYSSEGELLKTVEVEQRQMIIPADYIPEKAGYRFIGWVAGDQTYQAGDSYTVTENVTFTAVWEKIPPKTFTWTYMDGEEVLFTLPVTEGETYELKDYGELAPGSLKEGDSFLSWYCGETELKSPVCATADMTIQAKIEVTITFDLAGGEWTENSAYKAIKGESFSLPQVSPNKEGTKYEFLGFFRNGKEIKDSFEPETSVTLTAKWNQVLFTVNFVSDGQVISAQTVVTANQLDLDSLKPEKGDMKFLYWADENGGEVYFETLTLSEDRTFTAIFAFEVTFLTRDGETDHTVMCGEDEKIDFPEITLGEKESFVGWIDVKNEKIYSGKNRFAVTGNIKFRAAVVEMETVGEAYLRVGSGLADSGIQFKTLISGSDWLTVSPYATAGTLITQADCLAENEFTLDCLTEGETVMNIVSTKNTFNGEYKRVSASIINLKEYNYGKKFLARGYLKAEYADIGSGYVYAHYDKTFSVSAKELAEQVLGGNWSLTDVQKSILRAYAGQE